MDCVKYARKCSVCGSVMNEGWVLNGGCKYYCSEDCGHKDLSFKTWQQYLKEYKDNELEGFGNDEFYWTTWEDEEDYQYFADGSEVEN